MRILLDFRACLALLVAACVQDARVETRTVNVHVPAACATGPKPYALFFASGDYPAPADVEALSLDKLASPLSHIPLATRALLVDVSDTSAGQWHGVGDVPAGGDIDLLLWPGGAPCALTQPPPLDVARTDAAMGIVDDRHILIAGGRGVGSVPGSFLADLATGEVKSLPSDLLAPRMRASIGPFGEGEALVSGGVRPDTGELLSSAEVFSKSGDFDGSPILLSEGRTDHGSVTLPSGEALLVGGSGAKGVLGSVELVDPKTRRARTAGLAILEAPRAHPSVLRLASGEILVAGGVDAVGDPVALLEWLTPDGHGHSKPSRTLVASKERAFVALSGGGALAVIAPDGPTPGFKNVWVISAAGEVEASPSIVPELEVVRLFAGNRGAPILWNGKHWLRWQPWLGEFEIVTDTPGTPGPVSASVLSAPDGGLALWFTGTHLVGLRFDSRSRFAADSSRVPLLRDAPDLFAPDRLIVPGGALSFDAMYGLVLARGASAFLSDATFADFTLDITVPGATPFIVLRDEIGRETEIGGPQCPFAQKSVGKIHLERRGGALSIQLDDADPHFCTGLVAAGTRLQIGVRGGPAGGTVHGLNVDRLENRP